jgi:hypothetical protein
MNNSEMLKVAVEIDSWFEQGWREFVKHVREENRQSNYRLMKVVAKVKGAEYLESLKVILKTVGTGSRIRFSNKAFGLTFRKPEWEGIGDVYIDQRSGPDGMKCNIYLPVKKGKYLTLTSHQ